MSIVNIVEYSVLFMYFDIASTFSLLLMLMGRKLENFNLNPLRLATEITSHKIANQKCQSLHFVWIGEKEANNLREFLDFDKK